MKQNRALFSGLRAPFPFGCPYFDPLSSERGNCNRKNKSHYQSWQQTYLLSIQHVYLHEIKKKESSTYDEQPLRKPDLCPTVETTVSKNSFNFYIFPAKTISLQKQKPSKLFNQMRLVFRKLEKLRNPHITAQLGMPHILPAHTYKAPYDCT